VVERVTEAWDGPNPASTTGDGTGFSVAAEPCTAIDMPSWQYIVTSVKTQRSRPAHVDSFAVRPSDVEVDMYVV
jgi:hypothetical protein